MSNDSNSVGVYIVTVDEYYYIPKFLHDVVEANDINISGITTVSPSLGTQNMPSFLYDLLRVFGPRVFAKHLMFYGKYAAIDRLNRVLRRGAAYSPKTLALRNGIDYRHVTDVNANSHTDHVAQKNPDVLVSVAATQKFESKLLSIPTKGAINIHSSLLPEYRGVSPSFWALLNEEEKTGITVHYMTEEIDSGDLITQQPLEIRESDSLHSLNTRVAQLGSDTLLSALRDIKNDSVNSRSVDPEEGEYYSMPEREDVSKFLSRGNTFY
ncbi:Formyl transferase [Halovenus aranensis]|uniref:Formyl transferase n=1 Tax=Halovenus aranensis TaxID=890420 RepID=A0A1G8ZKH7_9EURY|nr:formyltransferase family protein [Halovenus aranensis]SDK15576.1 Formyl transferase [Halovenus aranensis]